jgi:hypothetical protein
LIFGLQVIDFQESIPGIAIASTNYRVTTWRDSYVIKMWPYLYLVVQSGVKASSQSRQRCNLRRVAVWMNRPLLSTRIQQMLWGADERLIAPTTDGKQTQLK